MGCCINAAWRYLVKHGVITEEAILPPPGDRPAPRAMGPSGEVDAILYNGNFLLATAAQPGEPVTAVAISGTTVVDVGDAARILKGKTARTQLVDLGGTTVAPGFIEAHAHIIAAVETVYSQYLGYSAYPKYEKVIQAIATAVAKAQEGDWLFFVNYDPSLLEWSPQGYPQLGFAAFDGIEGSDKVNIFVENASGHIAYANRTAFQTAGVTVLSKPGGGGHYGIDDGKLNGVMFEPPSFAPFLNHVPSLKVKAGALPAMLGFLETAQRVGITTVADPAVGIGGSLKHELEIYNFLASDPGAATAVVGSLDITSVYALSGQPAPLVPPELKPPATPGATGSFKNLVIPAMKIWADGSTQGYTGYLTQPYLPPVTPKGLGPDGEADWEPAQMIDLLGQARADRWGMLIHGNGDKGIDLALQALQQVYQPGDGFRKRIEHCTVSRPDQFDTMQQLGVTPTFLNNHIYIWGDAFNDHIIGPGRAARLDAAGDAKSRGMLLSFHCDYATSNPGPLRYMQTAVTRQTASGRVLGPEFAITAMEALEGVTINAAKQLGIDARVGTIEVGKDADLVHLAADPTTCAPTQIAAIQVLATWLKGKHMPIAAEAASR
jgi:predicted amidohydrolase YtcJ